MQLFTFLSIFLTLGTTAIATPAASYKPANIYTSYNSYLLQTRVINGGRKEFDGLYVESYHTGAGTNDVVLGNDKSIARRGQLSNGTQFFEQPNLPETLLLGGGASYDAWYSVQINAGVYNTDLFINSTGLQWKSSIFGGWLACDWSHGVPQLFWKVNYYNYPAPACAQVELRPVEKGKLFKINYLA